VARISVALVIVLLLTGCGSLERRRAKAVFEAKCHRHHAIRVIEESGHTDDEWEYVVKRMQAKPKANITDEEARLIIEYLESQDWQR
jgi:hypothetical protein